MRPTGTPQIPAFTLSGRHLDPSKPAPQESRAAPVDTHQGRLKFAKDTAGFLNELKRRVADYFAATGKRANDCWQMYLKTAIILAWFFGSYIALVFVAQGFWQAFPIALLLASSMAAVGFAIQHDGGHHAYSRRPWINKLAGMTLDIIGVSSYLWYWKHAIFHHTYCNVQGHDTDIDVSSLARFSPHAKYKKIQRWQHFYLWLLYGLMSSRWHLYGDFKDVATATIGPHRIPRPKGWDLLIFIGGKVISYAMAFVIPLFFHEWWVVLFFYLVVTAALGVIMSVVFQLAHCVEEAEFPVPEEGTLRIEHAWAVHQVETTVDFGRNSRSLSWFLGGLNFQIEHHLFPKVCHIHYPALSKIVEQTCKEYGVRYSVHPSFWAGIVSHYRWLKRMGRPELEQPKASVAAEL
jgi:linoleoyl-CoA desaturase